MPAIVGAHHTSFTVANLDRSVAFFHDRLGFTVLGQREVREEYFGKIVGLPSCRVRAALLRIPGANHFLELFEYTSPKGTPSATRPCDPGSSHLALLVDDLPALCDRLRSDGVPGVNDPISIDAGPNAGGAAIYLRDPNGILIELFQPARQTSS